MKNSHVFHNFIVRFSDVYVCVCVCAKIKAIPLSFAIRHKIKWILGDIASKTCYK